MKKLLAVFAIILAALLLFTACDLLGGDGDKVTVQSITVTKDSLSAEYFLGDALDLSGATIQVTYSNGDTATVGITEGMVSGFSTATEGSGTMTIAYQGVYASLKYNVNPVEIAVTVASVNAVNVKTSYVQNEKVDISGCILKVVYSDGSNADIESKYVTVSDFSSGTVGSFSMLLSCETPHGTVSTRVPYTVVKAASVVSLKVSGVATTYKVGDSFGTEQYKAMRIIPVYDDTTEGEELLGNSTGVSVSFGDGQTMTDGCFTTVGSFTMTVTYKARKFTIDYTVLQKYEDFNVNFDPQIPNESLRVAISDNGKVRDLFTNSFTRKGYFIECWYYVNEVDKEVVWDFDNDIVTSALTLYARWKTVTYTITYKEVAANSRNQNDYKEYNIEASLILYNEVKNGYVFGGFYRNSVSSEDNKLVDNKITAGSTGDLVLVAKWVPADYAITYILNDDAAHPAVLTAAPVSYTIESNNLALSEPVRNGYAFGGWTVTKSDSALWTTGTTVSVIPSGKTGAFTVSAVWTLTEYKVQYQLPIGATVPASSVKAYYITSADRTVSPAECNNKAFRGWYTDPELTKEFYKVSDKYVIKSGSYGDITLYPKFIDRFTFSFVLNKSYENMVWQDGGDKTTLYFTREDTEVTLPQASRRASSFVGWSYNKTAAVTSFNVIDFLSSNFNGGYTFALSPVWDDTAYTLTYDYGYDNLSEEVQFTPYKAMDVKAPTARSGYTFVNWTLGELQQVISTITVNTFFENIRLKANWRINSYKLELDYVLADCVKGAVTVPSAYTVEDYVALDAPTHNDKDFTGWYGNANGEGTPIFAIDAGTVGDKKLYAGWRDKRYAITYANAEESELDFSTVRYYTQADSKINLFDPIRTGYKFNGWYALSTLTGSKLTVLSVSGKKEAITIYASWSKQNYSITYNNVIGASNGNPSSYDVDSEIEFTAAVKNGYDFDGWYLKDGTDGDYGDKVTSIKQGSVGNMVLYAKWTAGEYSITYHFDGGNATDYAQSYTIAESVTLPVPEKQYFDFGGWYLESGLSEEAGTIVGGASYQCRDLELYAKWTETQYAIDYRLYKDGVFDRVESDTYKYSDFVQGEYALSSIGLNGYRFDGWYTAWTEQDGFVGAAITSINSVNSDGYVIYGSYTLISYDITYYLNNGSCEGNPDTYTVIDAFTLAEPHKDGYCFVGWFLESTFDTEVIGVSAGTVGEISLYAKFLKEYTIAYNVGAGTNAATNPTVYNETETITLNAPTPPTGYSFWAWLSDSMVVTACSAADYTLTAAYYNSTTAGLKFSITGDSAKVTAYNGTAAAVIIPSQVANATVTAIGTEAFHGNKTITGITFVQNTAFTAIENAAFSGCTSLANFAYPSSLVTIGGNAFLGCIKLTKADLSATAVTDIGNSAFDGNVLLGTLTLNSLLQTVGDYAFRGIKAATVVLPDTVTSLGKGAFYGATALKTVNIPVNASLTAVSESLFRECPKLTAVTIPSNVKTIGASAFRDSGLIAITIPSSVTNIGDRAFYNCTALATLNLNEGLSMIEDCAFAYTAILTVAIPDSVVTVGHNVLSNCNSLTEITVDGSRSVAYYFGTDSNVSAGHTVTVTTTSNVVTYHVPNSLKTVRFYAQVTAVCDYCLSGLGGDEATGTYLGIEKVYLPTAVIGFGATLMVKNSANAYSLVVTGNNLTEYVAANSGYDSRFIEE